jgi:two-component system chemotaxis sensor kinase CheA
VGTEDIGDGRDARTVRFRGQDIPVHSLARLLDMPEEHDERWIVVAESEGTPVGLQVSKVLDVREVVTKKLGPPLNRMRIFDGATVLGDGRPMMILDVQRLLGDYAAAPVGAS